MLVTPLNYKTEDICFQYHISNCYTVQLLMFICACIHQYQYHIYLILWEIWFQPQTLCHKFRLMSRSKGKVEPIFLSKRWRRVCGLNAYPAIVIVIQIVTSTNVRSMDYEHVFFAACIPISCICTRNCNCRMYPSNY